MLKDRKDSISFLQFCIILMLSNGLISHVVVNPLLMGTSGRDAWLVPLVTYALMIPWCWLLIVLSRRMRREKLSNWVTRKLGRIPAWILLVPLYAQIYLGAAATVMQTGPWVVANYLPSAPKPMIMALLISASVYAAIHGIRSVAIGAGVLLPFVILLGYFVAGANVQHKEIQLLFPVLEHGWQPLTRGLVYSCGCFMELAYLLPLQHYLQNKVKLWHLLVLMLVFIHIMIGPLTGAITEFGYAEAEKQMLSPYEQWRLVHIGSFIEHVDFFALYQWVSGASIRIALSMFLLADLIPAGKSGAKKWTIVAIGISYGLLSALPFSRLSIYEWQKMLFVAAIPMIAGSVLIWLGISFMHHRKEQPA